MRAHQIICVLVLSLVFVGPFFAQSPNGTISGIVLDPSGGVIVGAEILIVNDLTNVQHSGRTNSEGIYVVPNLPPGPYRLQVFKVGFKTLIKPDIILNVQDALAINFTLPVGAASETVTVKGGAPLVNTESAAVGTVIDREFVENLPLNGRSFNTLMELTPGVVIAPHPNGTGTGQFSIAGQRPDANNFTVDGVSANFGVASTYGFGETGTGSAQAFSALGGTSSLVSVDALQEFRIETSSYAPEFGRQPGGQVILTTRSGTNGFHGGIFDYFRNTVMDANDWFAIEAGEPRAPEHHNDFGGFLGGPVQKDKTFFFFSYEGARLDLPQTTVIQVPSEYARTSAPTALAPYLNAYPQPDDKTVMAGFYTSEFTGNYANRATLDAASLRVDHTFNDRFSIFGRYNYAPSQAINRVENLSVLSTTPVNTQTFTLGVNMSLSAQLSDTLRGNYSMQASSGSNSLDSFHGAIPPDSNVLFGSLTGANNLAYFFPTGVSYYSTGPVVKNQSRQFEFNDDLALSLGVHQLKWGGDYRAIYLNVAPPNYIFEYFAPTIQSFITTGTAALFSNIEIPAHVLTRALSIYGQDTWKLTARLTLTYGLRWEVNPAPYARGTTRLGSWQNVNNPSELGLAPSGTRLWSTTYGNIAPRIGLAFSLTKSGDLVLRAGWGIFYDLGVGTSANAAAQYPSVNTLTFPSVSLPLGDVSPYLPGIPSLLPPYPEGIYAYSPNLKLPRSYQWNVALEKSFAGRQVLSATYVGQAGRDLLRQDVLYQPNPNFLGAFDLTQNGARSNYNALQLQYRWPLSSRLQALLNYTWSHSLDNASNDVAVGLSNPVVISGASDYASSDFDVRQGFSGAVTYTLPGVTKSAPLSFLTGNWSISAVIVARTGFPFNMLVNQESPLEGFSYTRPDIVPGQPYWIPSGTAPGGKVVNPGAFVVPSTIRQGTEGRNDIAGFGLTQVDLSIGRAFPIAERLKLQFRADAFNLLNHPNFTNPPGYVQFGQYGFQSQQMLNQGLGGLNPLFQQGGPRSLQLSLRLAF